jgi:hypothetical protein
MKHSKSSKKIFHSDINDYKFIQMDKIVKMKKELESIDPYEDIENAMKKAEELVEKSKNKIKKDDLLEQIRINALSSFITDIKGKSENQIQKIFKQKVDEFSNGIQLIIDKTKKENKKYISQYELVLEEKKLLQNQISQLNSEYDKIKNQLKDNEELIYKIQKRFSLFQENKLLFDEFLKEFSNRNPIEVIKEIQTRQDGYINFLKEYNNAMKKIEDLKKERNDEYKNNKRTIEELSGKIYQKELDEKEISKSYEKKILSLKTELSAFKGYKEQNIILHKMLFRLYNRLIEAFSLEKNIKIDNKFLNIQESDFHPNLFDDFEIGRYIDLMISSMNNSTTDSLLRETIAYSNMMVRLYMKDKINLRYEPVRTFKELKNLMERKEEEIFRLKEKIKDLEFKNNQLELNNKKLNSSIKHIHLQKDFNLRNKKMFNRKSQSSSNDKILNLKNNNNYLNEKNRVLSAKNILSDKSKNKKEINLSITKKKSNDDLNKINNKTYDFNNQCLLTPEEREKFKSIYNSKNADKLIKVHGFQDLVTHLNEFRELVEHTNRLFLYQSKMNAKNNHITTFDKLNINNKKKRPLTSSRSVVYEDRIKDNIIKKLDFMIKNAKKNN